MYPQVQQMIDRISCAVKEAKWSENFLIFGNGYDYPECKSYDDDDDKWLKYKDNLFIDVII